MKHWTALPNFVDCAVFRPAVDLAEKQAARRALGVPPDALVLGCVAAVKKDHKRIDYLIHEFSGYIAAEEEVEHQGAKNAKGEGEFTTEDTETQRGNAMLRVSPAASTPRDIPATLPEGRVEKDEKPGNVCPRFGVSSDVSSGVSTVKTPPFSPVSLPEGLRGFKAEYSPPSMPATLSSPSLCLGDLCGQYVSGPYLLIAGAKTDETAELLALAESLIPGRYKILTNVSRAQMPDLYRCMDVFTLTSLFEMMPIALLEALASGLPVITNAHPVMMWMTGAEKNASHQGAKCAKEETCISAAGGESSSSSLRPLRLGVQISSATGGIAIDMSRERSLTAALEGLTPEWVERHGRHARARALQMFSREAVIRQYVEYYGEVMGDE